MNHSTSEAMEGLIAAQMKLEINTMMDKLERRRQTHSVTSRLCPEISEYLQPGTGESRECIVKLAIEKMQGVSPKADLGARVTEAAEAALLEEFHKGIDQQMRGYMK